MEVNTGLLNTQVTCTCGKTHHVPIERVVVGENITNDLVLFLNQKGLRNLLVVADANTDEAFGGQVRSQLREAGFQVEAYVFTNRHGLLPDEAAILAVRKALHPSAGAEGAEGAEGATDCSQFRARRTDGKPRPDGVSVDVVVAVGSGVIHDIVRYVTFNEGLPFISIATAPSMDGYASGMAAMQFHGIKVTTRAWPPIAIFAELSVLMKAPFALVQSGFGDLAGKVTSLSDWILAAGLHGEYFCPMAYEMVYEPLEYVLSHADELRRRDSEAVKNLFLGLVNAGIAMAVVGNSRPCSGSEHHCSHFWDLLAFKGIREHTSHGLQVGYAVHWTALLYRYLLEERRHEVLRPVLAPVVTDSFIRYASDFYGDGDREVIAFQREKAQWLASHPYVMSQPDVGVVHRALVSMMPGMPMTTLFDKLDDALSRMDIPLSPGFLEIDAEWLRQTFYHARELRARLTIFDVIASQDWLEDAMTKIFRPGESVGGK